MPVSYPFAALIGQEALKDALLWLAVDRTIGGVLVTGTRGTAKSTAVRGLADVLPPLGGVDGVTPFVELPIGATEDRVIGTLDVRTLLADGERRFEPGLLARAHRGILYVDEVNLLPDHIVDVLLDVAATGVNVVERDGASFTHDAQIVLVGTMNPEEGELRPQLLDRFGLCVAVPNDDDLDRRVAIVEQRIAFERDPSAFERMHAAQTSRLRERIVAARALLSHVRVERECVRHAATLALAARAEGMRADLTIVRTARAIAALDERTTVTGEDIERAAVPALAHRRREPSPPSPPQPPSPPPRRDDRPSGDVKTNGDASHANETTTFDVGAPVRLDYAHEAQVAANARMQHAQRFTARGRSATPTPLGVARIVTRTTASVAPLATVRAAAKERHANDAGTPLTFATRHLRFVERRGRERQLVLFLVDASGSMAAAARMRASKGVVGSLLEEAYHRRDAVALIAFRGDDAQTLVPPTRSAALAYRRLRDLATGGRTPLALGLRRAHDLIVTTRRREPSLRAHLVVITDARANVPAHGALDEALREAAALRALGVRALCVDTERGLVRLAHMRRLAEHLEAEYRHLDTCTERALGAAVHEWMMSA